MLKIAVNMLCVKLEAVQVESNSKAAKETCSSDVQ